MESSFKFRKSRRICVELIRTSVAGGIAGWLIERDDVNFSFGNVTGMGLLKIDPYYGVFRDNFDEDLR